MLLSSPLPTAAASSLVPSRSPWCGMQCALWGLWVWAINKLLFDVSPEHPALGHPILCRVEGPSLCSGVTRKQSNWLETSVGDTLEDICRKVPERRARENYLPENI